MTTDRPPASDLEALQELSDRLSDLALWALRNHDLPHRESAFRRLDKMAETARRNIAARDREARDGS